MMEKIIKFKKLLIMLVFFNISNLAVVASPATTAASILLLNSKKSEKNKEKTIEQINEEFKLLYEDKENFNELNTILSKDNKIFLIDKYAFYKMNYGIKCF